MTDFEEIQLNAINEARKELEKICEEKGKEIPGKYGDLDLWLSSLENGNPEIITKYEGGNIWGYYRSGNTTPIHVEAYTKEEADYKIATEIMKLI